VLSFFMQTMLWTLPGIELNNDSFEIDPQADAAHSTGDFENATAALEEGMHFDYNATPIMEFLNNDSFVGGCEVNNMILSVIPQVYSASLGTGVGGIQLLSLVSMMDMKKAIVLLSGVSRIVWSR